MHPEDMDISEPCVPDNGLARGEERVAFEQVDAADTNILMLHGMW